MHKRQKTGPSSGNIAKFFFVKSTSPVTPIDVAEPVTEPAEPVTEPVAEPVEVVEPVAVVEHVASPVEVSTQASTPSHDDKKRKTGFSKDWKSAFPWVEEVDGGMTCKLCIRHQQRPKKAKLGGAIWVDQPCTWMVREALSRHQASESHSTSRGLEANRANTKPISSTFSTTLSINKQARVASFRCIYFSMKREIPHTTNYLPLVDLCKEQGASVLNNLDHGGNDKGESQRFIQEAVLAMGTMVQRPILQSLRASPWYSIMVDETTDVAVVKELIIYARFLKDGKSATEFLTSLKLTSGSAEAIVTAILEYLGQIELDIKKMCAIGSDGASVMLGKHNGVAAQLRRRIPHLLQNHCVAHRLALAVGQAASGVPYLPKFKDVLGQLHRFYAYSSVRMDGLQQIQEMYNGPVLKLSQAKDVRWLSHDKATQTMKRCLPAVLASLEREAEERHDSQAMGLSVFVRSHKFIACINMMCDVLPHMSALSKAMQTRDAIYTSVGPLVNGTVAIVKALTDRPGDHYTNVAADVRDLQPNFKITEPTDLQLENFTNQTYKPFMRNLSANLESRFPDLPILENFGVFTAEDMDHNGYGDVEIKALAVHFSLDERYAAMEWSQLRSTICASPSLHTCTADQTMEWVVAHLRESHPNIYSLAVIGLLLPTSTADCERGFSALNRVKTTHRATLSQKVLNALLAVTMQGPPLPDFNFSQAVEEWHQTKPRRSQLS